MTDRSEPPYDLFAIRYATHSGRRAVDNFIGGDPHETGSDLAYYVWVARNPERTFVIDTGFGPEAATARGRTLHRLPAEGLALLGIEAGAVDHVILTHLHYDHAGTLSAFPRARFHVQDAESAFATGRCMCHAHLRQAYDVEDVVGFVRCLYGGRVAFHDGVDTLAPGLTLHRIGGHSAGLQVVRVRTRRGHVVIASDASHLYGNMCGRIPFPIVHNVGEMLEGHALIHRLAESPDHVIPGHDPLVMALYPPPAPELAGIVARLDVPPRPL
ncbi:N-acyl homoserine lactonase family protein [Aquabacter spiritensis]|uniref:Glyoxylase-like metal-dependent hydrolase (Beta-lactamase superfamily II) n=1 Tax=Aquabacter spiritensis TaxID=933073 RepID=A0A4R3LWW2_9HYPH|nr:N-acyl homoserine lactonase family protein [Aquabacter spiritensis]TCT05063.1 glyoxylase-like metal-dependent hydrolase (beta-lactamase superfamily II) [Aquabacter spiritensis]